MAVELVPLGAPGERGPADLPRARRGEAPQLRFRLLPFEAIEFDTAPDYLLKGWVPRRGLAVIWGPPKCGKSFWTFDLMMHVALGWDYRGAPVAQGPVVYVACEGADGLKRRLRAFAAMRPARHPQPVPFYLVAGAVDAQIAIQRSKAGRIKATLELMKDGPEGLELWSSLKTVVVGYDDEGEPVTSCLVEPAAAPAPSQPSGPKLSPNQRAMLGLLEAAGDPGLTTAEWNRLARAAGIGLKRKATLRELQKALQQKRLAVQDGELWHAAG